MYSPQADVATSVPASPSIRFFIRFTACKMMLVALSFLGFLYTTTAWSLCALAISVFCFLSDLILYRILLCTRLSTNNHLPMVLAILGVIMRVAIVVVGPFFLPTGVVLAGVALEQIGSTSYVAFVTKIEDERILKKWLEPNLWTPFLRQLGEEEGESSIRDARIRHALR